MTNREKLNQMSNEVLAKQLSVSDCNNCVAYSLCINNCINNFKKSCSNTIKEWLESDVEE